MQKKIKQLISELNNSITVNGQHNNISIAFSEILKQYLSNRLLRLECLKEYLNNLTLKNNNWITQPVYINDEFQYSINLICWPIGASNSPHIHKYWTVSGVLYGHLNFSTYKYLDNISNLLTKDNEFEGYPGKVGYVLPPCIHSVTNKGQTGAISMHIFSYCNLERINISLPNDILVHNPILKYLFIP